jgi:hypothetical protein
MHKNSAAPRGVRDGAAVMTVTNSGADSSPCRARLQRAASRREAWDAVLHAVADLRDMLAWRMERADPADETLAAECWAWRDLAHALASFLEARP